MKLNYKRTILVGMAFLSISAFWQLYDNVVPLILKNTFQMRDDLSGVIMALDNILALFLLPLFGKLSDKVSTPLGKRRPFIFFGTACAVVLMNLLPVMEHKMALLPFIILLGLLLIAMGTYRSPAVALMPDVTPKPLRSKGNAIINLMGALGGVFTLAVTGMLVGTQADGRPDYQPLFIAVSLLMVAAVLVLLFFVKENKLAAEARRINDELDAGSNDEAAEASTESAGALPADKRRSLMLILFSVFFWFMGYNAVTSKYSVYAGKVLSLDYNSTLLVANVAAILFYIPVGIIASKIGRKKTILIGIGMLATSFCIASFLREGSSAMLMNCMFALAGIGWATINVNSFPMVVELSRGSDVGRYTGFYYTASMAAQTVTPYFSGLLMDRIGMTSLFPYATVFVAAAFITMLLVKHGDSKPIPSGSRLEQLGAGEN